MQNGTVIQFFHWYSIPGGVFWDHFKEQSSYLAKLGINAAWLPPAFKATTGGYSVGYDVYDLYDLGEFDQKGTIPTKYGTKDQYIEAVKTAQSHGIQVYVDIVLNHLGGGDEKELIRVVKMDPEDRNVPISEPFDIEAYTRFTYPGRQGKYSQFEWNHTCFTGVDYDNITGETAIYNILNEHGSDWEEMVTDEKGNYDYLMYNDVEFRNPAVREELKRWGEWYYETVGFNGFRLDAVKHIAPQFYNEWLAHMRAVTGKNFFAVGEYWAPGELPLLLKYIEATDGQLSLFDAALHHTFHMASKAGNSYNMSGIFADSLVSVNPLLSVTVVDNHDTQPLQALEAPVEPWFKPIAYALILLRNEGYPCIFYPDLYGADYTDKGRDGEAHYIVLPRIESLPLLLLTRKEVAYGQQVDYFDHPNCIGWVRQGEKQHRGSGCAIVLSNGEAGNKFMSMGEAHKGKKFVDVLGHLPQEIILNEKGEAEFHCPAGSVSVWMEKRKANKLRKLLLK
jgi:alpha-amylase